jgi:mRNA interferase RelE/StbE
LFYRSGVEKFATLFAKDKKLIIRNIEQLAADPLHKSNVKKLVDFDAAAFRMRVGNYRILFDREDDLKIIDIIDILQRKQAYQKGNYVRACTNY